MFQQQQGMTKGLQEQMKSQQQQLFQMMCKVFMQQQQTQTQTLLELLRKGH